MINYKQRITLQSNSPTEYRAGCYTESWATVTTLWCNISYSTSIETHDKVKGQQSDTMLIVMRHTASIDKATCRFLYEGQKVHIMNIKSGKSMKDLQLIIEGRVEYGT